MKLSKRQYIYTHKTLFVVRDIIELYVASGCESIV